MTPSPEEIEAASRAAEEARKQQPEPSGFAADFGGPLDGLSAVGDVVVAVAEGAAGVVGGVLEAIGSVFDGF